MDDFYDSNYAGSTSDPGSVNYTGSTGTTGGAGRKPKKPMNPFVKKVCGLILSGVIFGVVAGGTMVGITYFGNKELNNKNVTINTTTNTLTSSSSGTSSAGTSDVTAIAKATLPAMVEITGSETSTGSSYWFGNQSQTYSVSGTGIIIGQNEGELIVLTNAHVVNNVDDLKVVFVDGQSVTCSVKGVRTDKDVAVVSVKVTDMKESTLNAISIAELGDSDTVEVGNQVIAIGNALGEGQSVTVGYVSALNREITVSNYTFSNLMMTDAAINSGNSGGALLDTNGKVIAINFAKTSETGVEGMAYAIPVSTVKDLIDSLSSAETRTKVSSSDKGFLGISGLDITSSVASSYGYPQGLMIKYVQSGSPAEKAGLGDYDIIVTLDGKSVTSQSSLSETLNYYKAGETVTVGYYHMENSSYVLKTAEVTLGSQSENTGK